jgi:hypothetical protein
MNYYFSAALIVKAAFTIYSMAFITPMLSNRSMRRFRGMSKENVLGNM